MRHDSLSTHPTIAPYPTIVEPGASSPTRKPIRVTIDGQVGYEVPKTCLPCGLTEDELARGYGGAS